MQQELAAYAGLGPEYMQLVDTFANIKVGAGQGGRCCSVSCAHGCVRAAPGRRAGPARCAAAADTHGGPPAAQMDREKLEEHIRYEANMYSDLRDME
jgi:hypothetical protein